MKDDGSIVQDGNHELYVYKVIHGSVSHSLLLRLPPSSHRQMPSGGGVTPESTCIMRLVKMTFSHSEHVLVLKAWLMHQMSNWLGVLKNLFISPHLPVQQSSLRKASSFPPVTGLVT